MEDRENRSKKRAKQGKERLKRTNKERTLTNDSKDRGNAHSNSLEAQPPEQYINLM